MSLGQNHTVSNLGGPLKAKVTVIIFFFQVGDGGQTNYFPLLFPCHISDQLTSHFFVSVVGQILSTLYIALYCTLY